MRFDTNDERTEEESSENDGSSEAGGTHDGSGVPSGAPAASRRAVQEAEKKAEDARERAQLLEEEIGALQEEIEQLWMASATHAYSLRFVFENASHTTFGKSFPAYEVPEALADDVDALEERETIDEE